METRPQSYAVLDRIEHSVEEESVVARLLERARQGDDLAFAEIYLAYFDRVRRYLFVALKNTHDADEAAQEVFAKVLRALPRFEHRPDAFRAWLFQIARNQAVDHHRKSSRTAVAAPEELEQYENAFLAEARRRSAAEGRDAVRDLVSQLPLQQQRVLVFRFVYDFTAVEIAELLDISPDAVRHLQMRGLRRLATQLSTSQPYEEPSRGAA